VRIELRSVGIAVLGMESSSKTLEDDDWIQAGREVFVSVCTQQLRDAVDRAEREQDRLEELCGQVATEQKWPHKAEAREVGRQNASREVREENARQFK